MRHIETSPAWVLRFKDRCRQRRADDRIARWIALPSEKTRRAAAASNGRDTPDSWSNDNQSAASTRAAG